MTSNPTLKIIADFTQPDLQPWKADGEAFDSAPLVMGEIILGSNPTNPIVRVMPCGAARRDLFWTGLKTAAGNENDSGRLGATARSGQMLRTPTVTLGVGKLHYLIRGKTRVYASVDSHLMNEGPMVDGYQHWDEHGGLVKNHGDNARAIDQPIAALLIDLKQRGLLDETLVVWAGEFGRTPFAQGSDGRDHNEFGFSVWLSGGGVRGGMAYGETDDWGYKSTVNKLEMHDLHATILHLMGMDHEKLTYRFGGRDFRLTDVHGEVVMEIIAQFAVQSARGIVFPSTSRSCPFSDWASPVQGFRTPLHVASTCGTVGAQRRSYAQAT